MKVISIGDSWGKIVAGGGTPWPDLLGVLNLNVSGSTAQQWAANKENWLVHAQEQHADAVIISLMGNDARHALEDGVITMEEKIVALASMWAVVNAMSPAKVYVLLYADPFCGKRADVADALTKLDEAIQYACRWFDVGYIDTRKVLGSEHFDGTDIHPNQAGHEAIAQLVSNITKENNPE